MRLHGQRHPRRPTCQLADESRQGATHARAADKVNPFARRSGDVKWLPCRSPWSSLSAALCDCCCSKRRLRLSRDWARGLVWEDCKIGAGQKSAGALLNRTRQADWSILVLLSWKARVSQHASENCFRQTSAEILLMIFTCLAYKIRENKTVRNCRFSLRHASLYTLGEKMSKK